MTDQEYFDQAKETLAAECKALREANAECPHCGEACAAIIITVDHKPTVAAMCRTHGCVRFGEFHE